MNADVVIIGAGIAGLTVASSLAGDGISSLLIESAHFPGGPGRRSVLQGHRRLRPL